MGIIKQFEAGKLCVRIHTSRRDMGRAAAAEAGREITELLGKKPEINMIFAAAPSQNEFLEELAQVPGIAWERINAFHMDEYIGLPADAPQGFGNFLRERIFEKLPFKSVYYLNDNSSEPEAECSRYASLLRKYPTDIVCMGIGENGHIAFNDPHVAFFDDPELVKVVALDERCRMQQVHDGCFKRMEDVPTHALTLTIPALMRAKHIYCIVPAESKEQAVLATVRGPISEKCPASILRNHPDATLYTDLESGKRLIVRKSVITDEISQDPDEAASLASKYGLEAVEIRSVWEKNPHELNDDDVQKLKDIFTGYGLKVSAICGPVFKCNIDNPEEIEEHFRILKKCISLAKAFDTNIIRGFTFWGKNDFHGSLGQIVSILRKAAVILERGNIVLALEGDPSVNATNASKLSEIIKVVGSPFVRALWDPGNDIWDPDGEIPYPEGYEHIRPYMVHMHLKDGKTNVEGKAEGTLVGEGAVDYAGQFTALLKDGYDGYVGLETHYRKKHEIAHELMKLPKGSAFSYMGREATEECLIKWNEIMDNVIDGLQDNDFD